MRKEQLKAIQSYPLTQGFSRRRATQTKFCLPYGKLCNRQTGLDGTVRGELKVKGKNSLLLVSYFPSYSLLFIP